jgi:hypothetical protein
LVNRVEINNRRHYVINSDKTRYLPSVTTILGTMTDQSRLIAWKKRVGEQRAAEIGKFSANRGSIMHLITENYFFLHEQGFTKPQKLKLALDKTYRQIKNKNYTRAEIEAGRKLFYHMYMSSIFDRVNRVLLQEQVLYSTYKGGYAGQVDKVYLNHDNQIIITDYKSSTKHKEEKYITGYKMQASAYYVAFWERFKKKPGGCEIWIANNEYTEPQLFTLNNTEVKDWYFEFCKLLIGYHEQYDTEVENYIKSQINK